MGAPIAILIALAIVGAGTSIYVVDQEYVPINLETKPTELGIKMDTSEYEEFYSDILSDIPNIDKIEYDVYLTSEDKLEVINYYKREVTETDAYAYLQDYSGEYEVNGFPVVILAFQKGATIIAIGVTDSKNIGFAKETTIIYTTGAIWDYQNILSWYRDRK